MPDRFTSMLFPEMEVAAPSAEPRLPDAAARAAALDVRRSFVVEAPAGSGKTGLLIQRYLKLLSDDAVTEPEQVLAITFTKKAAGEMRDRVLAQLDKVQQGRGAESEFEQRSRELASAVLERDRALGWRLLEQPFRLNLRTIDSVCAQISRSLPVLSGSAGNLRPLEDAEPLFHEAARRTLLLLADGRGDASLAAALRDLLLHRDANLRDCEELISEMLKVRDQWGMLVPLDRAVLTDEELDGEVLPKLQRTLEEAICAELSGLAAQIPGDLMEELAPLAEEMSYSELYEPGFSPLQACRGRKRGPEAITGDLNHWRALIHLLVKPSAPRDWRKSFAKNTVKFVMEKHHQTRLKELIAPIAERPDMVDVLCRIEALPDPVYPATQWSVAKSLFRVLRRALVELQIVFAERGTCDFTEVSLLARAALRASAGAEEMASALAAGAGLQHLLVDEMQDTSTGQYELIQALTQGWEGVSQTVFLVGDPRQSIYMFRQARVENFIQTLGLGRLGEMRLDRLRLTANFRSQRVLVEQFNEDFAQVFARGGGAPAAMELPYSPADAVVSETHGLGRRWHARPVAVLSHVEGETEVKPPMLRLLQARRNGRAMRDIAQRWIGRALPANRTEPWRIAVLVRNRRHLTEVVSEFQNEQNGAGRVPYKATEIEPLNERQEVLDLLALTRALLHPADRVAGLALLRTPWCGLSLADLLMLTGGDEDGFAQHSVMRLMEERGELLSPDGCARMRRLWTVLEAAHGQRGRISTAEQVERAWRSLGGDLPLREDELANARRYLELLDEMETRAGAAPELVELDRRLQRLFAEPQTFAPGTPFVELLTMHRAKGLEWDVVLIPALERWPGRTRPRLLTWAELSSGSAEGMAMMVAPIAARGEEVDGLTKWLKRKYAEQEAAERKRLFYVAATRAREELHFFGSPDRKAGEVKPAQGSLLQAAWKAAEMHFPKVQGVESGSVARLRVQPGVMDLAAGAVVEMPLRTGVSVKGSDAFEDDLRPEATEAPLYLKPIRPEIARLPENVRLEERFAEARAARVRYRTAGADGSDGSEDTRVALTRPEGSLAARSVGNAVHALLELIAERTRAGETLDSVAADVERWRPRVAALLRAGGIAPSELDRFTRDTMAALGRIVRDSVGRWVLAAHPGSGSEYSLVGPRAGSDGLYSIRVDRVFVGGPEPRVEGEECLWIVDYKTATHGAAGVEQFLIEQRHLYAPQLEGYARVLAAERAWGLDRVRVGLYYPALPRLVWWVPSSST